MAALSEARKKANRKWDEANKQRKAYINKRSLHPKAGYRRRPGCHPKNLISWDAAFFAKKLDHDQKSHLGKNLSDQCE